MASGRAIQYTDEMLEWIEANQADISRAELTRRFNKRFNMNTGRCTIPALCVRKGWISKHDGRIKKGDTPWNKGKTGYMGANATSFKKGQKVHNHRPVGSERITKDGYIQIKVAEPSDWQLKHIVVWESRNGKVPLNHCIRMIDGNRTNVSIDNLLCIPRGANAVVNKFNNANTDSAELNKAILLTETLKHKLREVTA